MTAISHAEMKPGGNPQGITVCLWFDNDAEEAVNFYTRLFAGSKITGVARYGKAGSGAS